MSTLDTNLDEVVRPVTTPKEIAAAAADWREARLGQAGGYAGPPLEAPPLDVGRLIRRS